MEFVWSKKWGITSAGGLGGISGFVVGLYPTKFRRPTCISRIAKRRIT